MLKADKPPLLIKAYNSITPSLGLDPPLDFDKLIQKARRNTGLQNLGKDFNEFALQLLIRSINEEAQLHPFGRLMIREKLISQLENRLWAEHWFSKYPEILEQALLPIILITGIQRTGTTKMQRLLSSLADARALRSWEALYPAPLGHKEEHKKRLARTKRNEKAVKWISPTFHHIHPIYHDQPEEDLLLLDLHFMSSSSEAILHIPSYAQWLQGQDQREAYAYERKLLLLLQWQQGGKYWILKSPHHLEFLPTFVSVFPASKIIWMHRSLSVCIPSFLSMLYHGRAMFSTSVDIEAIKRHWLKKLGNMLNTGLAFRQASKVPILDISYRQFMKAEAKVLNQISQQFSEINIHLKPYFQKDSKQPYRSKHQYDISDWGLSHEEIEHMFSAYHQVLLNIDLETVRNG